MVLYGNPTDQLFWDDFDTEVLSGFGQLEMDVGDRGELALAIRYDEEDREVSNRVPNVLNAQIFGLFGQAPINPAFDGSGTDVIPDRDETFDEWQPKLSYTFSFTGAIIWLLVVIILSAIASFLPAWNASRITVQEALAYE